RRTAQTGSGAAGRPAAPASRAGRGRAGRAGAPDHVRDGWCPSRYAQFPSVSRPSPAVDLAAGDTIAQCAPGGGVTAQGSIPSAEVAIIATSPGPARWTGPVA